VLHSFFECLVKLNPLPCQFDKAQIGAIRNLLRRIRQVRGDSFDQKTITTLFDNAIGDIYLIGEWSPELD